MSPVRRPAIVGLILFLGAGSSIGADKGIDSPQAIVPKQQPAALSSSSSATQTFLFKNYPSPEALTKALPGGGAGKPKLASHLRALRAGFGDLVEGVVIADGSRVQVLLADHSLHTYDDGRVKTPEERVESADIKDMFHDLYPLTNPTDTLPTDFDPGRARPEAFFKAIFGGSAAEVSRGLESVDFCGSKVDFNGRNGAAAALRSVSTDLVSILARHPELKVWTAKLGGTYAWRPVAGTSLLSMHGYGAAIDLNPDSSAYWRWGKKDSLSAYSRKGFPSEIIEAFERHGFIWGGKWYHYDTMHFEYRPEVIDFARRTDGMAAAVDAAVPKKTGALTPAPVQASMVSPPARGTAAVAPPGIVAPKVPAASGGAVTASRRVALLMSGSPGSPGPSFPPLSAMDRDLSTLSDSLKKAGFAVTTVENPTLAGALAAVESFGARLPPDADAVLFYFTGHACQHEDGLFLIPGGAQITQAGDVFAEAIPLDRVKDAMKKSAKATRIVFLEAPRFQFNADAGRGLAPGSTDPGFFFGYASRGASSTTRDENGGLFTQGLARHIKDPGISLTDMFSRVARDLTEASRRTSAAQQPESVSTLTELFFFADPPGAPLHHE